MWWYFRWVVVLALVVGSLWGAGAYTANWWRIRNTPRYLTTQVTRGSIESVVNSTGTVKPVRTVQVGAFVSGPVKEVFVDFNSRVEQNQVLATIDPALLKAAVKRDEAILRTQQAERARVAALLKQSRNNEKRGRQLISINKDYLSDTELDQLRYTRESQEAQLELATASIQQGEANLENSRANLNYTSIVSPVSGIIIERKIDPGQTVAASFQTPELFTVAPDMEKHMHIFASVDEADIGLIRTAQERKRPVSFTVDAYPHDLFKGQIYQVRRNSTTTQNVVTYPVIIESANPDLKLMPGMTANISFHIETCENALRIPAAALRFVPIIAQARPEDRSLLDGSGTADSVTRLSATQKVDLARGRSKRIVWVKEGDHLRAITVVLGLIDGQYAELIQGDIEEGQQLVTGLEAVVEAPTVNVYDLVLLALRTLAKNKLRSGLTVLGVVIGIAAVITMVSIGQGGSELIQSQFRNLGSNVIIVLPASSQSGGVRQGQVPTLTPGDAQAIALECPSVKAASPLVPTSGQVVGGNVNWKPNEMIGVGPDYLVVRNWALAHGEFFSDREVSGASKVCVLGQTVVNRLFSGDDPLGQLIRIKSIPFRVVGVLARKGANLVGQDQDNIVLLPYTTVQKRIQGSTFSNIGVVFVSARSDALARQAETEIRLLLMDRHKIAQGQPLDFEVRNTTDVANAFAVVTGSMTAMLSAIAAISLIVGGVGIMNIMLVSVTERTREIGIRMALGARPRDILRQFLVEAVVLSSIGGVIGIALGIGASAGVTALINLILPSANWPLIVSIPAALVALVFAAVVGIFFGFYPARRASRLDPIEALRYE